MLPFDRLVKAVDEWARDNPGHGVFIQIGEGAYEPHYASYARIMPMADYREGLRLCDLFVAHVGMGAILQGLEGCHEAVRPLADKFSRLFQPDSDAPVEGAVHGSSSLFSPQGYEASGWMFWFMRKKLPGSYVALICCRRL